MNGIPVSDVRSLAVMGHTGSGKTTLIDAILFKMGVNDRLGSVDNGSSMADWTDPEKARKITMYAKPFNGVFSGGKKTGITLVDTPGYMDFYGQVIAGSQVCDAGLIVIDAASGIQLGTTKAWNRSDEISLPRAIVVTGLDKENVSFADTVSKIQETWGNRCQPMLMPTADASGVVDVLGAKDVPDDLSGQVEEVKGSLVELAAETDDTLIEKYLGGEELSAEEIADGLRSAVNGTQLVPIFACVAQKDVGVAEILESVSRLMPSPLDRELKDSEGNDVDAGPDAPFTGFVWRTMNDAYVGQLTFMRVCSGTLKGDSDITNASNGQKERLSGILSINGKEQDDVKEATAGDIVALTKLKSTKLNDTLCASGTKVTYASLEFPAPVVSFSVKAKSRGDEDKIGTALQRVSAEDPTIKVDRNDDTHELLISGMGDIHIETAVEQMKARSNVEVVLNTPKVPYRETVTAEGKGRHKHKKQSGGHGQYGEVYLLVQPKRPDDEEWFVDKIVGGAIPSNFIPAVQKGLVEGMQKGAVAGYPVTNVKVTLYDGSFHAVDSSEVAFKIAAAKALKEAMGQAKAVLLEPIMIAKITIPERFMGDVSGDLSHKRGRILGMEVDAGQQVVTAEVPQAEMFRYCAELRSITAGEGSFTMTFDRYDVVPSNIAQKVIDAAAKDDEDED